jgi:hypothetical protein
MKTTGAINDFLLANEIWIRSNPAISPDLCLDPPALERAAREALPALKGLVRAAEDKRRSAHPRLAAGPLDFFPASELKVGRWRFFVVEHRANGDAGLLVDGPDKLPVPGALALDGEFQLVPMLWSGLPALKNLVQKHDAESTVFPVAGGALARSSLGIGARFTSLHWPAVAWVMQKLGLPLTANQNSIPRELVYDVDAMLEDRLAQVPFPFIGGSVPEGHQGQSVEGMSHASILAFLKIGFHRHRVPWGFNDRGGARRGLCLRQLHHLRSLAGARAARADREPCRAQAGVRGAWRTGPLQARCRTTRATWALARRDPGDAPVHLPAAGDAQARAT